MGNGGNRFFFAQRGCLFFYLYLCSIVVSFPRSVYAEGAATILEIKNNLSLMLDSLEMETQRRLRQKKPIDDLEKKRITISDSINNLRKSLHKSVNSNRQSTPDLKKKSIIENAASLFSKQTIFFDWLIIIVGSITLFSGLLLIGGLFFTIKSHKRPKETSIAKNKQQKPIESQPPIHFLTTSPSVTDTNVDNTNKNLNSIQKKINDDIEIIQHFNQTTTPVTVQHELEEPSQNMHKGQDIANMVKSATENGLSISEISRKYHISVDQITLILHISELNKLKNQ